MDDALRVKILRAEIVDEQSGEGTPRMETVRDGNIKLAPFAVAVVSEANN